MDRVLERRTLARQANALNARAPYSGLPALILLSDDTRLSDPCAAAWALPPGALLILRHRNPAQRRALAFALKEIAHTRHLLLSIANDVPLAHAVGADGVHFSQNTMDEAVVARRARAHWLISVAAHSLTALARARIVGADAALLGSVFASASHPGQAGLGAPRARFLAQMAPLPVYALGGVVGASAGLLAGSAFAGLAAIGALQPHTPGA